ncbi:hypothetical protein PVAND_000726 [Polypedilum vanderplanki]|uniref:Carbohydrate kinase PfkB domain-containing protein n=1 Tax=Polypedilum vanderplanki TaxID=319348 RepID=A0A9J6BLG3_POLVA|nr:hypothetical protein PVAND_000726 [Polypedilum vanderplanki]
MNITNDKKILLIRECVLDIIQIVKTFPKEDDDVRSINAYHQRGGNASNTSTVLTNLGWRCELLTTFADDKMFTFIIEDLKDRNIDIKNCRYYSDCNIPLSTVLLSKDTGARTIIHNNKNLPHVLFEDFDKCNLNEYFWVHFEARSVPETTKMMQKIIKYNETVNEKIKISLELEKKRDENLLLVKYADVVILGRDYAEIIGCHDKKTAIYKLKEIMTNDECYRNEKCVLVCPWGKDGACAIDDDGNYYENPIFEQKEVVDTLGAGDTFVSGLLHSLMKNFNDIPQAIKNGCMIAGYKCGFYGYDCVKNFTFP